MIKGAPPSAPCCVPVSFAPHLAVSLYTPFVKRRSSEIKLNKFYNTFAPAHSPLTWPLDWNAISCDFFSRLSLTNDDDANVPGPKEDPAEEEQVHLRQGRRHISRRLLAYLTSLTYNNKLNCSWPARPIGNKVCGVSCSYICVVVNVATAAVLLSPPFPSDSLTFCSFLALQQ